MAEGRRSPRSHAPFTDEHLKRLVSLARSDQKSFFQRNPHLGDYRHRLLLIALCQGGALHYLDCKKEAKKTNGVKDLDVYSFYADDPEILWPYRRHGVADFGVSEFGHHPNKRHDFVGRHVDLMGRALQVEPDADPVLAVCDWLATSNNKTPRLLRKKAVVGLYPARYRGKVIWDPYAEGSVTSTQEAAHGLFTTRERVAPTRTRNWGTNDFGRTRAGLVLRSRRRRP